MVLLELHNLSCRRPTVKTHIWAASCRSTMSTVCKVTIHDTCALMLDASTLMSTADQRIYLCPGCHSMLRYIYSRTPVERPPSPTTIPLIRPYFLWRCWSSATYLNPSRATIPLIRPHQCDSEGGRIRGGSTVLTFLPCLCDSLNDTVSNVLNLLTFWKFETFIIRIICCYCLLQGCLAFQVFLFSVANSHIFCSLFTNQLLKDFYVHRQPPSVLTLPTIKYITYSETIIFCSTAANNLRFLVLASAAKTLCQLSETFCFQKQSSPLGCKTKKCINFSACEIKTYFLRWSTVLCCILTVSCRFFQVSERDMRMTFLPQFKACVQAGSYNVMCSYNR